MPVVIDQERDKYERIWAVPDYGKFSPGEKYLDLFYELAAPEPPASIVDIGAGSGRAALALHEQGFRVSAFDITDEGYEAKGKVPLLLGSVWRDLPRVKTWNYGYCCDMLEHIPTEYVMLTLERIQCSVRDLFCSISTMPDGFGAKIGETLHMTVQPFEWWHDRLRDIGDVTHARDLLNEAIFYVRCR